MIGWPSGACSLLLASCAMFQEEPRIRSAEYECGTLSLYVLNRVSGRGPSLVDVEHALPPSSTTGYSLGDLRGAASALGLELEGVRLRKDRRPPSPALVFTKNRGVTGHFYVIRPVGHSGALVQVLDSSREPYVVDYKDLCSDPGWTGIALVPAQANWPAWVAGGVALASGLALAAMLARPRRQPQTAMAR